MNFLFVILIVKECMIHGCPNCPENTEMLESKLYELIGNYDDKTVIELGSGLAQMSKFNIMP